MESVVLTKFKDFFKFYEDIRSQIDSMIDSNGYVLLFKLGKDVFGAGEDSRVVFARMKIPDDDMPKNWEDEASFSADNLNKSIRGEPATQVFHQKDLKKIKVLDRDKVVEQLVKAAEKQGGISPKKSFMKLDLSKFFHHNPDDAPNFVRADED